jgi:hypothetical protein
MYVSPEFKLDLKDLIVKYKQELNLTMHPERLADSIINHIIDTNLKIVDTDSLELIEEDI